MECPVCNKDLTNSSIALQCFHCNQFTVLYNNGSFLTKDFFIRFNDKDISVIINSGRCQHSTSSVPVVIIKKFTVIHLDQDIEPVVVEKTLLTESMDDLFELNTENDLQPQINNLVKKCYKYIKLAQFK